MSIESKACIHRGVGAENILEGSRGQEVHVIQGGVGGACLEHGRSCAGELQTRRTEQASTRCRSKYTTPHYSTDNFLAERYEFCGDPAIRMPRESEAKTS